MMLKENKEPKTRYGPSQLEIGLLRIYGVFSTEVERQVRENK